MSNKDVITKIIESRKNRRKFKVSFMEFIDDFDEHIVGKVDIRYILGVFLVQGFWSGVKYRIYYEDGCGFTAVKRVFG